MSVLISPVHYTCSLFSVFFDDLWSDGLFVFLEFPLRTIHGSVLFPSSVTRFHRADFVLSDRITWGTKSRLHKVKFCWFNCCFLSLSLLTHCTAKLSTDQADLQEFPLGCFSALTNNKHLLYLQRNTTGGKSADPLTWHQRTSASVFTTWHAAACGVEMQMRSKKKSLPGCDQ